MRHGYGDERYDDDGTERLDEHATRLDNDDNGDERYDGDGDERYDYGKRYDNDDGDTRYDDGNA